MPKIEAPRSPWNEIPKADRAQKAPSHELKTDVCIIGAGISGLTTAYLLSAEGRKVTLVDMGLAGSGETLRTTAHLSNAIDTRYLEIEKLHGHKGAVLAAQSHTAAIAKIEEICTSQKIECGFVRLDGFLVFKAEEKKSVDDEFAAANRAGVMGLKVVAHSPVPAFGTGPALRFPNQAQIDPSRYLSGLLKSFINNGGEFYPETKVTEVKTDQSIRVSLEAGQTITAGCLVVATNSPINDRFIMHTKQAAYRTYAQAYKIPAGSVPHALYWDTEDPYHYVRIQQWETSDLLIVGGEDHKTGQSTDEREAHARLERWAKEHFDLKSAPDFRWSGQVEETVDGLAYIGPNPADNPKVFIATGDCGMGMTHGTIAGILLTDLIQGRKNSWSELYDPARKNGAALKEWSKENLNTSLQYRDYLTPADVDSVDKLSPGEGAIVREGIKKVAAFRDDGGKIHRLSAVCPHLGALVRWNTEERTWDCPCHGSRFAADGKVINGPSTSGLKSLD